MAQPVGETRGCLKPPDAEDITKANASICKIMTIVLRQGDIIIEV
jgi:hypothetical protein